MDHAFGVMSIRQPWDPKIFSYILFLKFYSVMFYMLIYTYFGLVLYKV